LFEPGKNLFRRFFPRLRDPLLDAPSERTSLDSTYEQAYRNELAVEGTTDEFSAERYAEGCRWRSLLKRVAAHSDVTLDLGAGNGAVELSFRAAGLPIVSVEREWNDTVRRLHARVAISPHRVLADAAALPFREGTFTAVICLETIEHLDQPAAVGREVGRVLKPSGLVLITTPSRWRYLFRPDPHFGIRGLVALPARLQRWIAAARGYDRPDHYVSRIYASTRQVEKVFPGCAIDRVLSRTRTPRRYFWDAVVLKKTGTVHSVSTSE
jgi:SAM-dependent methyltransferase